MTEEGKRWIFSYGSNSSVQLRARVENPALQARPAVVNNWARIFCLSSRHWCGSVASLAPMNGVQTFGGAVELSNKEISLLDKYEGSYDKVDIDITIVTIAGEQQQVRGMVYVAVSPKWTGPPSEHYLTAIHLNLREHWGNDTAVSVAGLLESSNSDMPLTLYDWRHPGSHSLTLHALCVEVNALKSEPWVMPRTITEIVDKLNAIGIYSAAQFAVALSTDEKVNDMKRKLEQAGHLSFNAESVGLFKQLLLID
jgi:cation transport regulator ChaC